MKAMAQRHKRLSLFGATPHIVSLLVALTLGQAPLMAFDQPKICDLKTNDHVMVLGDSTTAGGLNTAGYVRQIEQAIGEQIPQMGLTVSGVGRPGAPSVQMIEMNWIENDVKPLLAKPKPPTVCIVNMGLNDAVQGEKAVVPYGENLRAVVRQGRALGLTMILCTPTLRDGLAKTQAFAEKARVVAAEEKCPIVDLYAAHAGHILANTKDGKLAPGTDTTYDGVHLTGAGETASARAILQAFGLKPVWQKFQIRNKSNPDFGSYTIEPAQLFYEAGAKIAVTAIPAKGKVFSGWAGDMAAYGTQNPVAVTVDRHMLMSIPKREFRQTKDTT
jgi:lysophospholipase L1-like esterase